MNFYKGKVLNQTQLKRLADHKYNSESLSLLDKFLQPWWNWLVGTVPLWVAPNLITIVGLIINIVTTLVLVWFSPDARKNAPGWSFLLCAIGLFSYQSLDAIDGKQARRTGSSSPLGELFDHGCDSVSTVFVAISACIAVKLGTHTSWMFFQCFCALTLFYCAHWQAYVSGTVKFGRVDVTEAQFTIIIIHLISAFCGPDIWTTQMPYIEAPWCQAVASIFMTAFVKIFIEFCHIFWTGGVGKNGSTVALPWASLDLNQLEVVVGSCVAVYLFQRAASGVLRGGVGKNGSSVAGTSVLSPIIPLSLVVLPAFIISAKSESNIYENHPVLYILAFGLVAAKVTNRLVVAHMTRSEMNYLDTSMLGPAMLFMNQYFNCFISEYIVLWICLVFVCGDLLWYSWQVCQEICDHMRIQLFRIVPNPGLTSTASNKNGTTPVSNTRQTRSRRHYH